MSWDENRIQEMSWEEDRIRDLANRLSALTAAAAINPSASTKNEAPPVHEKSARLTIDYLQLAANYRRYEQYRSSSSQRENRCIICRKEATTCCKVFYPCQHSCVCDACILRHRIRPGHSKCPLCKKGAIQLILKNRGGRERGQYDDWLAGGPPTMASNSFTREFPSKSLLEMRWARVVDDDARRRPLRSRSKVAKSSVLPAVMEEEPASSSSENEISSSTCTPASLPEQRQRSRRGAACSCVIL